MTISETVFDFEKSQEPKITKLNQSSSFIEYESNKFIAIVDKNLGEISIKENDDETHFSYKLIKLFNIQQHILDDEVILENLVHSTISFTSEIFKTFDEYTIMNTVEGINLDFSLIDPVRLKYILELDIPAWRKISAIGSIVRYVSNPPLDFIKEMIYSESFKKKVIPKDDSFYLGFFPDVSQTLSLSEFGIEQMDFTKFSKIVTGINIIFETDNASFESEEKARWINSLENKEKTNTFGVISVVTAPQRVIEAVEPPQKRLERTRRSQASSRLFEARRSVFASSLKLEESEEDIIISKNKRKDISKIANTEIKLDKEVTNLYGDFNIGLFNFVIDQSMKNEISEKEALALSYFAREVLNDSEVIPVTAFNKKDFTHYYRNVSSQTPQRFKEQFCLRTIRDASFISNSEDQDVLSSTYLMRYLTKDEMYEFSNIFTQNDFFSMSVDKEIIQMSIYFFLQWREEYAFDEFIDYYLSTDLKTRIKEPKVVEALEEYFKEEEIPLQLLLSLKQIELKTL